MTITPDDVLSSLEDLDREARIRALRAALAEVEQENARRRYPTPGHMAADLERTTVQTPALELIDREVAACVRDGGRLIISVPPQEGKSTRVAVWTPVWALMRNPDLRIVVASYAESLARRNAMQARALVQEYGSGAIDEMTGEALPDRLGLRVAYDHRRANSWAIQGRAGGYYATGVSGSLTGRAADCVHGDTGIVTEYGNTTAREAYERGDQWILSFNHEERRSEWRRVEARRRIPSRPMVAVETETGNILTCTPDHRVYASRGYTPAGNLRAGETILQTSRSDGMPPVRKTLRNPRGGSEKSHSAGLRHFLRERMLHTITGGKSPYPILPSLLPADTEKQEGHMFGGVPTDHSEIPVDMEGLRTLRGDIPRSKLPKRVLRENVRRSGALYTNDGEGKQPHNPLVITEGRVQPEARGNNETGREQMRRMRRDRPAGGSPQKRGLGGQPRRESGDRVQLSPFIPSSRQGAVAGVTASGVADAYDFQVEGNRNFYASGVLVHNCLIIDDPVKNQQQADSAREREKVWEWWTAVANTRLAPGAAVIVIMTRWHEDDLAGGIITADRKLPPGEREWRVVNVPAVAEAGIPDALERAEGEPLVSARGRTGEDFRRIKRTVGPRVWGALYQGMPTPSDGGLFSGEEMDRSRVTEAGIIGRVVTVDPAESGHGDEAGLLVMGWDDMSTIYVEEDHSGQMTSAAWSRAAVETALRTGAGEILYEAFTAKETYRSVLEAAWREIERQADLLRHYDRDALVAAEQWHNEGNEGDSLGFMQRTLEILDRIPSGGGAPFTITPWRAPGDKVARAAGARQAVSTGRLRMIGQHPVLERQARTWQVGQGSPDRVDAMVNGYEHISGIIGNSGFEIESPWE